MTTKMNLGGTTRKALVAAIAEITGEKAVYRAMPTCNYDIDDITVTKDGCIICPDDSDILTALAERGFTAESDATVEQNEATGLLEADRLDIKTTEDAVSFPWWDTLPEPEKTQAFTAFIAALCKMAKEAKRVTATEKEVESEKYAFRGFLLRLGFIGADSKTERKILLRNLSGHSAFRNKAEEEKFKANQKAKRDAAKAAKQADKHEEVFA